MNLTLRVEGAPMQLAVEHDLEVLLDKHPGLHLTCTPEHLDELIIGHLFTKKLIRGIDDIESLFISEQGQQAQVLFREMPVCDKGRDTHKKKHRFQRPVDWEPSWLRALVSCDGDEKPLYKTTRAVHASYLLKNGKLLCCREDLSRHNTLDKVIGYALIHSIDMTRCLLYTTGRMPTDMVFKVISAGIPVLASKTYPTDLAVKMAKHAGLTLITLKNDELITWSVSRVGDIS